MRQQGKVRPGRTLRRLRTHHPAIELAPEIKEAFEKDPIDTRIGYEKASNLPLTARSMFSTFSTHGEVDLRRLEMTVDMWMTEETPTPHVFAYTDSNGESLIQVAEVTIPKGKDGSITLLYSQTRPTTGIPKSQEGQES